MIGRRRLAVLVLLGALGLPAVVEAQAGPEPVYRPDAVLRRNSESARVGDGIYNRDSSGQTRVSFVPRQGRTRFVVRVENDGNVQDDFVIRGARNTDRFGIRYFVGTQEVSARVGDSVVARVAVRSGTVSARLDRVKPIVYRVQGRETAIVGRSLTTRATAERWARSRGAASRFVTNARLFWELAPPRGIRPEVAYAQSAKETGYGNFGGVIDASFRNPCGLKTTAGGGDGDANAHKRFASWREGIAACIDHLALYAGAPGYPRANTPDPRHFPSLLGTARTVERLGTAWAPAPDYGLSIVQDLLTPMLES